MKKKSVFKELKEMKKFLENCTTEEFLKKGSEATFRDVEEVYNYEHDVEFPKHKKLLKNIEEAKE